MSYVAKGRNVIHNGNFNVWQRGTAAIAGAFPAVFTADRWSATEYSDGTYTVAQSTDVPNLASQFSLKVACTGTDATIAADQICWLQHTIEVSDFWDILGGRPMVLSFWVKAYQTGVFTLSLRESTSNSASYAAEYTINASATWEKKTIQIPAPGATGTWSKTTGAACMSLNFGLAIGSNWQIAANTWSATNDLGTSNQTNFMSSTDNYIYFSQVQLEAGTAATEFDAIPYADELARCQRYLVASGGTDLYERHGYGYCYDTTHARIGVSLPVQMRAIPAIAYTTVGNFAIYATTTVTACSVLAMERCSDKTASMVLTIASGATAMQGTVLMSNGQVTDKLFFTAEI